MNNEVSSTSTSQPDAVEKAPEKTTMDSIWNQMLTWPLEYKASFLNRLAHSMMIQLNSAMIDTGVNDLLAKEPAYVVAARGEEYVALLARAVALVCTGRGHQHRIIQLGERSEGAEPLATPLSIAGTK